MLQRRERACRSVAEQSLVMIHFMMTSCSPSVCLSYCCSLKEFYHFLLNFFSFFCSLILLLCIWCGCLLLRISNAPSVGESCFTQFSISDDSLLRSSMFSSLVVQFNVCYDVDAFNVFLKVKLC